MKLILLFLGVWGIQGSVTAAPFEKILECDGGAAVVDVDARERRNLQLVIRDTGIIEYLNDVGAIRANFGDEEAIIRGFSQTGGVFSADQFQSFEQLSSRVFVYREGGGLKLTFQRQRRDTGIWWCDGHYTYETGGTYPGQRCDGLAVYQGGNWRWIPEVYDEYAGWFFNQCG